MPILFSLPAWVAGISWGCNISNLQTAKRPSSPLSIYAWVKALGVSHRDPHTRLAQPWDHRRSHVSPAYIGLETSCAYQRICSAGGCHWGCGGAGEGHFLLPGLVSWYLAPVYRQLPMPTGELPWPPRGPYHVGFFSHRAWTGLWDGGLASGWWQLPHIGPQPAWWCLPPLQMADQWGQDVLDSFLSQLGSAWHQARQPP